MNRRKEQFMTACPVVNCVRTSVEAVVLDSFGKRMLVIWKLAVCCYWVVILICKMVACLRRSKYSTAVELPLFCWLSPCAFAMDCLSVCVCSCVIV